VYIKENILFCFEITAKIFEILSLPTALAKLDNGANCL